VEDEVLLVEHVFRSTWEEFVLYYFFYKKI